VSVTANGNDEDRLADFEAWLTALESMIALLAAQLPAAERSRFVAALQELEATAPELNARLSWSAALNRVRSLIEE
jgi:surfactin synthase thioesterase subunit